MTSRFPIRTPLARAANASSGISSPTSSASTAGGSKMSIPSLTRTSTLSARAATIATSLSSRTPPRGGRIGSCPYSRRPSCKPGPMLRHSPSELRRLPSLAPRQSLQAPQIAWSVLSQFAPDVAVGILDSEGFRHFVGPGLEKLNAASPRRAHLQKLSPPESAYLFSDLSQWMLKVLLAPLLPVDLLRAPRRE
jgi:hypothetical protein